MAYLLGIVNPQEAEMLAKRGWELEDFEEKSFDELCKTSEGTNGTEDRFVMVFVDSDLSAIMSGPDWPADPIEEG